MIVYTIVSLVFGNFLQCILRSYLIKDFNYYHTLTEYCNHDLFTKILFGISIVSGSLYVLYVRFSMPLLMAIILSFGGLCRTNKSLLERIGHYIGLWTFAVYTTFIIWQASWFIYIHSMAIVVFLSTFYSKHKLLCFFSEWIILTACSFFMMV